MKKNWKIIIIIIFLGAGTVFLFWLFRQSKTMTVENQETHNTQHITQNMPEVMENSQAIENEGSKDTEEEKIKATETKDVLKDTDKEAEEKDEEDDSSSKTGLISWGFSSGRNSSVDTIIVHSVYNKIGGDRYSLSKILDIFKEYGVAAHYIIERDGDVHQLVAEKNTAYHAGNSQMPDGRKGVNDFSVGIEVINSENDQPTNSQYKALDDLIGEIKNRHKIKYILGHSDIASGRKTDPWNFDWDEIGGKKD